MADGFLSRWSRRKLGEEQGDEVQGPPIPSPPPVIEAHADVASSPPDPPPPPTLEDAQALTPESDFTRFAMRDVAPNVKNTALKKLFADPRYNVMDGLDVYIDDYSKPDPIPESMLRSLVSAKFLGLFKEEEEKEEEARKAQAAALAAPAPRDVADDPDTQSVAQSHEAPTAVPEPPPHADPDLRLQPNHAPPGKEPGGGAG